MIIFLGVACKNERTMHRPFLPFYSSVSLKFWLI